MPRPMYDECCDGWVHAGYGKPAGWSCDKHPLSAHIDDSRTLVELERMA